MKHSKKDLKNSSEHPLNKIQYIDIIENFKDNIIIVTVFKYTFHTTIATTYYNTLRASNYTNGLSILEQKANTNTEKLHSNV